MYFQKTFAHIEGNPNREPQIQASPKSLNMRETPNTLSQP
jgi:hypothetical protein